MYVHICKCTHAHTHTEYIIVYVYIKKTSAEAKNFHEQLTLIGHSQHH